MEILKKPVWLLGGAFQISGWILQAAAPVDGSLIVVQSICALSLVIALPFGARLTNQRIGRCSIIGAFATLIGIIAFLALGQPQGGISQPSPTAWLVSGLIILAIILLLGWVARKRRGTLAAALFATAA